MLEPVGYVCDSRWTILQLYQLNLLFLQNGDNRTLPDVRPRVADELEKSKIWKLTEINEPSQLRSLCLPDSLMPIRVCIALFFTSLYMLLHFSIFPFSGFLPRCSLGALGAGSLPDQRLALFRTLTFTKKKKKREAGREAYA